MELQPIASLVPASHDVAPAEDGGILSTNSDEQYPEGRVRAWLVVFGAWCAMFASTGLTNTFGVLHAWISTHQLAGHSEAAVGWIFSVHVFVSGLLGMWTGELI